MKFNTRELNMWCGSLQIKVPTHSIPELEVLQQQANNGKVLQVEIKVPRKARSLDANAFCWVLCQKIAEVVEVTKEEVYRQAVRSCGGFTILPIKSEAAERFIEIWSSKGVGWIAESLGASKLDGFTNIAAYHGSSTYDTKEMSRLVDFLVDECTQLGIDTDRDDIDTLLKEWGAK